MSGRMKCFGILALVLVGITFSMLQCPRPVVAFGGLDGTQAWAFNVGENPGDTAAGDVDNDNGIEIVVGTATYLYCINGSTGAQEWVFAASGSEGFTPPAISDLDHDGETEIITGNRNNYIYCIWGRNGTQKWNKTTGNEVHTSPAIGDVDGDGFEEVVIGSNDQILYCLAGNNGSVRWTRAVGYSITSDPIIFDPEMDGRAEIVLAIHSGIIFCFHGENGTQKWNYTLAGYFHEHIAVGDVDDDGWWEVIAGTEWDDDLYCFDGRNGMVEWISIFPSVFFSSPIICNVDGDADQEIVLETNYNLAVFSGRTGALEWKIVLQGGTNPAAADTDGDGVIEILVARDDNSLVCVNGMNGTVEWAFPTSNYIGTSPSITDADGDGRVEVIIGSNNGYVYCITCSGKPWAQPGPWPNYLGCSSRGSCALDADHDLLPDRLEASTGLNPADADTDGDGISDGWEIPNTLNPFNATDAALDFDSDGLSNLGEYLNHTRPHIPDTDGDGLLDGIEVLTYFTNPNQPDSDDDGLSDWEEIMQYDTNPNSNDTDGDDISDFWEVTYDIDPCDAGDRNLDYDGDGLTNYDEYRNGTDPRKADTDDDGLNDMAELTIYLTDPALADTDGDYVIDGQEILQDTNPLDRDDPPINYGVSGYMAYDFDEDALVDKEVDRFTTSYGGCVYSINLGVKVIGSTIIAGVFVNTENSYFISNLDATFSFKLYVIYGTFHACAVGAKGDRSPTMTTGPEIYSFSLCEIPLGQGAIGPNFSISLSFNFSSSKFYRTNDLSANYESPPNNEIAGVPPYILLTWIVVATHIIIWKKKRGIKRFS